MNNKPITILKDEFAQKLVDLINNSGLPLFIIEYILSEVFQQVHKTKEEEEAKIQEEYKEQNKDKKED